jgi:glutaredoxin
VEIDEQAAQEMMQKSQQTGVPVLEIKEKIIIGFDKKKIEQELENLKER